MIKLDPLYLLLLIELTCIVAAGLVFFLLRYKKFRILYQETLKGLMEAKQARDDLRKRLNIARSAGQDVSLGAEYNRQEDAEEAKGISELRTKLHAVEEELKAKSHKMEQLKAKFADLEKEYMILYQQQQSQQQEQPKIP
jgi:septal ring factor EnvC (AmiA/AmiB activator)